MAKMLARALCALALVGCGTLRTEFYRGEVRHLYARGCAAYTAGDFVEAHEALTCLVALDPRHARAHAGLGHLALVRGDGEAAESCYGLALFHEPALSDTLLPWIVQARALQQRQRLQEGGIDLKHLLALMESGEEERTAKALEACENLDTLARDAFSLAPAERVRLGRRVLTRLLTARRTPAEELFGGLFLAVQGEADALAVRALEAWLGDNRCDARRPMVWSYLLAVYARMEDAPGFQDAVRRAEADGVPNTELARARRSAGKVARGLPPDPPAGASRATAPAEKAQPAWFRLTRVN